MRDLLLELAGLALVFLMVAGIAWWKARRDRDREEDE